MPDTAALPNGKDCDRVALMTRIGNRLREMELREEDYGNNPGLRIYGRGRHSARGVVLMIACDSDRLPSGDSMVRLIRPEGTFTQTADEFARGRQPRREIEPRSPVTVVLHA